MVTHPNTADTQQEAFGSTGEQLMLLAAISANIDIKKNMSALQKSLKRLLISVKEIKADIENNFDKLKGTDTSAYISTVDELILETTKAHGFAEDILSQNLEIMGLDTCINILAETIETLYDTLRLLKRANSKKSAADGGLAKIASVISLKSLVKALHDH